MKREILYYPESCLARKSVAIESITPEIRALAADMAETMYESEGIGLAAPQVGECLRLVVVDVSGPDKREDLRVLINPRIVSQEGKVVSDEGCLSVPRFRAEVARADKVTVLAQDLDGAETRIDADGILAICLQHEIDHLEGVLFIDRLSRLKRTLNEKKIRKLAAEKLARRRAGLPEPVEDDEAEA